MWSHSCTGSTQWIVFPDRLLQTSKFSRTSKFGKKSYCCRKTTADFPCNWESPLCVQKREQAFAFEVEAWAEVTDEVCCVVALCCCGSSTCTDASNLGRFRPCGQGGSPHSILLTSCTWCNMVQFLLLFFGVSLTSTSERNRKKQKEETEQQCGTIPGFTGCYLLPLIVCHGFWFLFSVWVQVFVVIGCW